MTFTTNVLISVVQIRIQQDTLTKYLNVKMGAEKYNEKEINYYYIFFRVYFEDKYIS